MLRSTNRSRPHSAELSEWFNRACRREEGALQELLALYRPLLLQSAQRRIRGPLQTKVAPSDIVQTTLWKASQHFKPDAYYHRGAFAAWLSTILRREIEDARRRYCECQKRDVRRERPLSCAEAQQWLEQLSASASHTESGPLETLHSLEDLRAAVASLPGHYQLVLRYRYHDQLKFTEIGDKLKRSPDAARTLHQRALQKLAQTLRQLSS